MVRKPTGEAIAAELGVSPGRVSQLKSEGMPVDDIGRAVAWYARRVNQVRSLGQRMARERRSRPPAVDPARVAVSVAVRDAMELLEAGVLRGREGAVRAALAAVPLDQRADVALPPPLARALVADVHAEVVAIAPEGVQCGAQPLGSDADREWLGAFWYSVMAGEITVQDSAWA